jgi:hypothetical protein
MTAKTDHTLSFRFIRRVPVSFLSARHFMGPTDHGMSRRKTVGQQISRRASAGSEKEASAGFRLPNRAARRGHLFAAGSAMARAPAWIAPVLVASMAGLAAAHATTVPLYQASPYPTADSTDISGGFGAPGSTPLTVTNQSNSSSFSSQEAGTSSAFCCAVEGGYGALASASGSATASAGLLKGMVSASASVSPLSRTGSTSPYSASAGASYLISFSDSLTLKSTTLPLGSMVTWDFTLDLHESIRLAGSGSANLVLSGGIGNQTGSPGNQNVQFFNPVIFGGIVTQGPFSETYTVRVSSLVGQVIPIGETLEIFATDVTSGSAIVDASDTGLFYANPVTPGLELVSASGHDYATPGVGPAVPEPSAWAMMLLGFAGLSFVGYQRAKPGRATGVSEAAANSVCAKGKFRRLDVRGPDRQPGSRRWSRSGG